MIDEILGRVSVIARGEYDAATDYERLDAISYNGSSYLVLKSCRGVTPAESEYYMLMAKKGADGEMTFSDLTEEQRDSLKGTSVTVSSVSESTVDGGGNVVTFSDGSTLTVKNGSSGRNGANGLTPVRGVDYWTEEDISEIKDYVDNAILGGAW